MPITKRHHVTVADNEVKEVIENYSDYNNMGSSFPQRFKSQSDLVEFAVLYCLHHNVIQKVNN